MKFVLPLTIVILSVVLAFFTWYATLMPFWAMQSGQKGSQIFYSQGMGLWLNYTEHVGDPDFDPGNSLWVPPQESAVHTYTSQCQDQRTFCVDAIGDLHIQYCEVVAVYCGYELKFLQVAMAILSGAALLGVVWSVMLVVTTHRTVIDYYLMQLCIFNGLGFLVIATVWYFAFFRVVLSTTFYKDQYTRCSENPTNRSCWHIGTSVYLLVASAVLNPMLSVLVATYVGHKFKHFQRKLRKLLDMTTAVELPLQHTPMDTRAENVQGASDKKMRLQSSTMTSLGGTELQATATSRPLQPLQRVPSAVKAIDVHELDAIQVLSDGEDEEEKARDDAVKYGVSKEFVVHSPQQARAGEGATSAASAEPKSPKTRRKTSKSDHRKPLVTKKSVEF